MIPAVENRLILKQISAYTLIQKAYKYQRVCGNPRGNIQGRTNIVLTGGVENFLNKLFAEAINTEINCMQAKNKHHVSRDNKQCMADNRNKNILNFNNEA